MAEFALKPQSPLAGYARDYDGISIVEITDRAIVSLATPNGGEVALSNAIAKAYGTQLPEVGAVCTASNAELQLLGLQPGQLFIVFARDDPDPVNDVRNALGRTAYFSDQSDSWVVLSISGARTIEALERICPLDLHPSSFPDNKVARTVMEHLAVIIAREGTERFMLMSPRSSARSFLHALEISIQNIV